MPRHAPIMTLREICLDNVAKNIEYWCNDYVDLLAEGKFMYVLGPFDIVPANLIEDIIQVLKTQKRIRRHHLHLLIVPHLQNLNLSREKTDLPFILELTAYRCQHLKKLDLSFCTKIPRRTLKEAIPAFGQLQEIHLGWSNVTDDILATLGAYAGNLRILNVSNTNITDFGITSLCVSIDNEGGDGSRFGKCKKLEQLGLLGTKVGTDGIRCALENLPNLRSLCHNNSVAALDTIYRRKWMDQELDLLPQHHLGELYLDATDWNVYEDTLQLCVKVCPKVYRMTLDGFSETSPTFLLPLAELPALIELSIIGGDSERMEKSVFLEGVYPILSHHGETLTHLTLAEFPSVNVELIGKHCVNLQYLNLILIASYESPIKTGRKKEVPTHKPFSALKTLKLVCMPAIADVPEPCLKSLLSSQNLRRVFIQECHSLTDQLMLDVLRVNKFPQLVHWQMEYCHNVTAVSMMKLLQLRNPLQAFKLRSCQKITRADADQFTELIRKKDWQVAIDWI